MYRATRHFPQWFQTFLLVLLLVGLAGTSWANHPAAGQHYPEGAEDFVVGALPPPGVYLKNYFVLVQKDRLMDDDGKKAPPEFKADVTAVVPRFIWVTPKTIFGASYGVQAFFPLYWSKVQSADLAPGGLDSDEAGLGDIILTPLILGWHFSPNFHVVAALDIWAPTGDYQSDDIATQLLAKNHWTFEPVVAVTYLWNGFDFSGKFMYDFNTKNDSYFLGPNEGELTPGQEFHFDWAVSYAKNEGLRYGISGYCYWQTTKDEFDADAGGPTVKADKGVVYAAGPTIKYWPNQGRFSATLKHQWEFGAENLPEGQTSWLNLIWVF
jgi:hypothetical protein